MSVYINGASLNIADIVRIEFQDTKPNNTGIETISSIVMQYDTFKGLYQTMGKAIEDHDAKLAKLADDKKRQN